MEPILIFLLVYLVVGLAYGIYDDGIRHFRRLCAKNGGITIGDIVKFSPVPLLYLLIGGGMLVANFTVWLCEYVSDGKMWNRQIIRCGKPRPTCDET